MLSPFRILVVGDPTNGNPTLVRLVAKSDIVIDGIVPGAELISRIAERVPDLVVVDIDADTQPLSQICDALKANPATVFLPLLGLGKSARLRVSAFTAGIDDYLTASVRREEFLVRVHALLRASAARRQLAAQQLAAEVGQREHIRRAFRRYISPKLADRILAEPQLRDALFADTRASAHAAVMFADMRGFTGISEHLSPSAVVELLNEFFALLTDITFEYDGTVFNMAGDSLMGGFGVPVEQSDGALRAIRAAQLMLQQFDALASRWKERHGFETGLGIGINAGEVIAGNVGSPAYMNYTIIGDTVNVASRLGQRARAGELLFSQSVKASLDATGVDVGALPLPPLLLRGRSSPIDIFCVPSDHRLDFRPTH